jgi:para-aminobenzoate synthetase component 1
VSLPSEHGACVEQWPSDLGLAAMCFGDRGESLLLGVPGARRAAWAEDQIVPLLRELASDRSGRQSHPHYLPHSRSASDAKGWLGWISYDAGRVLEPSVDHWHAAEHPTDRGASPARAARDRALPLAEFARIENGLIVHAGHATPFGDDAAKIADAVLAGTGSGTNTPRFVMGSPRRTDAADFERRCARVIEYIRAGDVYQVNLAHRIECDFEGSPRGLFAALLRAARPWHGGYFEGDTYAIASASPELFLELGADGRVVTRPMKGTRPAGGESHRELRDSAKDQAELAMIVDLMRNDLGRVCVPGSMRVDVPREIERHDSGVLQATATVSGALTAHVSRFDLLRATFPAGSVTGAPKVRAMQIIDELEPVKRGPYCGSMVWLGDDGTLKATVLIRTAVISGGGALQAAPGTALQDPSLAGAGKPPPPLSPTTRMHMDYSVGAGIVADSVPGQEWRETLDKAALLGRLGESTESV